MRIITVIILSGTKQHTDAAEQTRKQSHTKTTTRHIARGKSLPRDFRCGDRTKDQEHNSSVYSGNISSNIDPRRTASDY